MASQESHNIRRPTSSVLFSRKAHFKLNNEFGIQVHSRSSLLVPAEIQNGVSSICAINADVIFETYEDIATGKLQIRRFQPPHSGLTTLLQATPLNIYK